MASTFKSKFNTLSLDGIQPSRDKFNILFNNRSLVLRKDSDSLVQYYGNRNIMLGYDAGNKLRNGDDNLFIGYEAGLHTNNPRIVYNNKEFSSTNIFLGSKAGYNNVHGYSNMYIGYNNSKELQNIITGGENDEKIHDNISIGSDGSAYGASTITLGNRTITNEGTNTIIIGHDSSNIGRNAILFGEKISNTGDNTFILHSEGNITNDQDNYFNLNDVFTGVTSNIHDGRESYLDFNLDRLNIHSSLVASNIIITDNFTSEKKSQFQLLTVTEDLRSEGTSTFIGACKFNDESVFDNKVTIGNTLTANSGILVDNVMTVPPSNLDNSEVIFHKRVSFPRNQTFSNETIFTGHTIFSGTDNSKLTINTGMYISSSNLLINNKTFEEHLGDLKLGDIPISSLLPSWVKFQQINVNLSAFNNDLALWLQSDPNLIDLNSFNSSNFFKTKFPWLENSFDPKNIGLDIFNNDNFAPWINTDPSQIDLSLFYHSNLIKPWVYNKFQRQVSLSGFSNDLIPEWALNQNQAFVDLSKFNNDLINDWVLNDQSNVNLSDFNNDHYKWLDDLHEELLKNGNNEDLQTVSTHLKNKIAPWLRYDPNQITLTQFYNDISEWNSPLTFQESVTFNSEAFFLDSIDASNIKTNDLSCSGDIETQRVIVNETTYLHNQANVIGDLNVNEVFTATPSNIIVNGITSFHSNVTFSDYVSFFSPVSLDGFISSGSNLLEGTTTVSGSFEAENMVVHHNTDLHNETNIMGNLDANNIFKVTRSNIQQDSTTYFTSNVLFTDYVNFKHFINLEVGFSSTGTNTLEGTTNVNGAFVIGNDVLRVDGDSVIINGNLNLFEGLIDIVDNQYSINTNVLIRSNVHILYMEDQSDYAFEVTPDQTIIRNKLHVLDSMVITEDRIDLSSNIHMYGNVHVNDLITITQSNIIMSGLQIYNDKMESFMESHFNSKVHIRDADFIVSNQGVDVFRIEGNTVYFDDNTLEAFQKNINIYGRVFGNDALNAVEIYSDLICYSNLQVRERLTVDNGAKFSQNVEMKDNLYLYPNDASNSSWWKIYSTPKIDEDTLDSSMIEADLVFKSKNGAVMRFHDTFEESIINFTGQHRCTVCIDIDKKEDLIGKIVVSTGIYKDLHDNSDIRVSEAIPIVKIATKKYDKSVFGVISGIEPDQHTSTFSIGHISFTLNKNINCKKAMVNSVGEGGIWVCNINGNLENGDFICTSIIDGLGMRQDTDNRMNYTVAKITCDCSFDISSPIYKCSDFEENGQVLRKAFVGCVYCC